VVLVDWHTNFTGHDGPVFQDLCGEVKKLHDNKK